ncbi:hypothetical protein NQ318_009719 [Aromia moschata]|uniref:DUF5641 domain-containing protein n=1 Tax=Aromia moschata TaxID=1265417 RepID=A0AAV8Y309_9CUCU|nr:hypothetical protein NQ318_009719 [Aromia moschata]
MQKTLGLIWSPSSDTLAYKQSDLPDMRKADSLFSLFQSVKESIFNRFSNFLRLKRVVAYIFRFVNIARKPVDMRIKGSLTVSELNAALEVLVKLSQLESFPTEIHHLQNERSIPSNSKILSLNPFLDEKRILRVGGRLASSNFSFDKKHPILLSDNHKLTKMLLEHEHIRLLHCGPQQLLSSIRDKFWPTRGRTIAKKIVHKCLICFRFNSKITRPIMAEVMEIPDNRLSLFHRIQKMKQHFWQRWSKEFVSELQNRVKWKHNQSHLKVGTLVLIKDDQQPPLQWKLGRVLQVHPGKDSISRVATIRTRNGDIRRAFSKICPLPVEDEKDNPNAAPRQLPRQSESEV